MPTKPRIFEPQFAYHIYNRGVGKSSVFRSTRDYRRFLDTANFYRCNQKIPYGEFQRLGTKTQLLLQQPNPEGLGKRVEIIAFCLMPNHFHFLLKPADPQGITNFVSDLTNSYTKYFNIKNERSGYLFQGTFKSRRVDSEMSLLHLSRYIHLNPINSTKTNPEGLLKLENYPYSSYPEWIGIVKDGLIDQKPVKSWLSFCGSPEKYKEFVEAGIDQDPSLTIADLILEEA